jgi:hypothetical protein
VSPEPGEVHKLSVDPASRVFRERLLAEHETCREVAGELLARIADNEARVDAAMFDLYEISESQRGMVEAGY